MATNDIAGNLVCPASFDLGVECKVAVLSVTEGEDKPLKNYLMSKTMSTRAEFL